MRLAFLGTRGGIRIRSRFHRRHSALLVMRAGRRILIDCGDDWRGALDELAPDAILVTHAHPDHAGALVGGAPCPVYASAVAARALTAFPIDLHVIAPRTTTRIAGLAIEAVPVVHSIVAPAVGFRIEGRVFYVPDVVDIRAKRAGLGDIELYIGDGARLVRPLIRRGVRGHRFGHTSVRTQLAWCADARVQRAIFTHCGTEVVRSHRNAAQLVHDLGVDYQVDAGLARDGLVVEL